MPAGSWHATLYCGTRACHFHGGLICSLRACRLSPLHRPWQWQLVELSKAHTLTSATLSCTAGEP